MSNSVIIKNIGEFHPESGTNIVTFEYEGRRIDLKVPTSVAINEDKSALNGWALTVFKRYLAGEKYPGY